jgi:hypothetical protein
MRKILFIILVIALVILLNSKNAKGDSISADIGMGDKSTVAYGLSIQKDWSAGYINLENTVAGNGSSNETTVGIGAQGFGLNSGFYGGDKFVTGQLTPVYGIEAGGALPIGRGFFLKDLIRIGRQTGSDITYGSMSAGIGLTL